VKIGIIVDGDAEMEALKLLTKRLAIEGIQVLAPIYANMQPKASAGQIARAAVDKLGILKNKQAARVVVLIDRENRTECTGDWAKQLEEAFQRLGHSQVCVVVKNRKFENWLISDVDVFKKFSNRYKITTRFKKAIVPNQADSVDDAEGLLNSIIIKNAYHKRRDAQRITSAQDVILMAENSRSFRRFLRLLDHPYYQAQSKLPYKKK
jgi:hypothetical protein